MIDTETVVRKRKLFLPGFSIVILVWVVIASVVAGLVILIF